ncbi:MAG: hypothetical protein PVH61_37190 [Candidatus Aminicenantes bacterium]
MVEKERGKLKLKCECDLYILGNEKNRRIRGKSCYLSEEFNSEKNRDDYRIILLFDQECKEPVNCIIQALEEAEFRIKQPQQYKSLKKFEETGNMLLIDSLNFFNAPCMMVEKNLKKMGFSVLLP